MAGIIRYVKNVLGWKEKLPSIPLQAQPVIDFILAEEKEARNQSKESILQKNVSAEYPIYDYWKQQSAQIQSVRKPFRVLILTGIYPQITERYQDYEIDFIHASGVELAVWAEEKAREPDPSNPYKKYVGGKIKEVVADFKPDLLHFFWLNVALNYYEEIKNLNLPMTARNHSFETNDFIVEKLIRIPQILRIFTFPQMIPRLNHREKLVPLATSFGGGNLFYPSTQKDKNLVVRAGAFLPNKAYEDFIDTALLCPSFEFLLILGLTNGTGTIDQYIIDYNIKKGSPVKLISGPVYKEEMAAIMRRTAIYMHTISDKVWLGMPVSILEALACSCIVLVKDSPDSRAYYSDHAYYYQSVPEAALIIQSTRDWSENHWQHQGKRNAEFLFHRYTDIEQMPVMIRYWELVLEALRPTQITPV
jgi:glycosyltransferase involved in cell wall biosynthesis